MKKTPLILMLFYHGTTKYSAKSIEGPPINVDISKGGGELGKGFYLGDNMTLAISWAKGRNKKHSAAVLEFDVDNRNYAKLAFKQMGYRAVKHTWRQLKLMGTTKTHTFGYDVIFGPLATASYAAQYKFESKSSGTLLNSSSINRIL